MNHQFQFNDHVCAELLLGAPIEKRSGRLVQIRKGCGQFGSDIYLIRLRDGSLTSFENVLLRLANDRDFERAFYESNGRTAPVIPEQPPFDEDSEETTYYLRDQYPETGFFIENPAQPQKPGVFTMTVIQKA